MNLLGLLLFMVVILGYFLQLRQWGVAAYLGWITSFWIITLLLYAFAMTGYFQTGIYVVTGIGLVLFIGQVILRLLHKVRGAGLHVHIFDVWMILGGILIGMTLQGMTMVHYDNFSHWATIVKFMFFEQRLPGASDTIISFSSYPIGTALFNNYFINFTGFSSGNMLVAQFIYIWATVYGVFEFLKDKKRVLFSSIICMVITLTMFANVEIGFNNLLVDYVIAAVTVAGFVGACVYGEEHPWLQAGHVFLASANLLLIKNSGAFFVAVLLINYFVALWVYPKGKAWSVKRVISIITRWLAVVALSVTPFLIWLNHVKSTFTSSKHQLDAAAFSGQLNSEGIEYMREIAHRMLDASMQWSSLSTRGMVLINITMLAVWIGLKLINRRSIVLYQLLLLDFIFILYYISIFAMYLVSMPYDEAIVLAGFERYLSTVVVLLLLWGAGMVTRTLDDNMFERNYEKRDLKSFRVLRNKKLYQRSAFALLFFAIIGLNGEIGRLNFNEQQNADRLPFQLAKLTPEEYTYNDKKVLLVDPETDEVNSYYAGFAGKYYFFSANVDAQEAFDYSPEEFKKHNEDYDYVLLLPKHETYEKLANVVYHQKLTPGLYQVTDTGLIAVKKMDV
ncbi:ABC transporter permease [Weissella ceti]|uniref:ABC transporter permease n=1 Tax=Weissella ceti TaxID=759620 RepID=A0ABT3E655_9LACO|nr:ABC transporter permease [Weissella ceti]MCW0953732.1 ABC transporter permease [Weissella ceti]QVK11432.1 ABC transporter permease [Weissella ceti]